MNKYEKEIKRIIEVFQNGNQSQINTIKIEVKARLHKYAMYTNRRLELEKEFYDYIGIDMGEHEESLYDYYNFHRESNGKWGDTYPGSEKDYEKLSELWNELQDITGSSLYKIVLYESGLFSKAELKAGCHPWNGEAEAVFTDGDLEFYENFIDDWAKGEYESVYNIDDEFRKTFYKLEDFDHDADVDYIFFGIPYYHPPMKLIPIQFDVSFDIIFYIANRSNWRNGTHNYYWDNGNKRKEGNYDNDWPNGGFTYWSPDGKESYKRKFTNGKYRGPIYRYRDEESSIRVGEFRQRNGQDIYIDYETEEVESIQAGNY